MPPLPSRCVVALIVIFWTMALKEPARADIDLTGNWTVEYNLAPYAGLSISNETIAQTASDLAWDGRGGGMVGTIDPTLGGFHVEAPPHAGGYPPPDEKNGQASDDAHFTGLWRTYAFMAGIFQPVDFAMRGVRTDVIVCGDAIRDPGEQCDDGAANGMNQCCDATCMTVDPDGDGLCSGDDNCPNDFNPDQTNVCDYVEPFTLIRAEIVPPRHPDDSKIAVVGTLAGPGATTINALPSFRIVVADDYDRTVSDLACIRNNPRTVKCKSPDKAVQVQITTTASKGTALKAKLKRAAVPAAPPAVIVGPITVSLTDGAAVTRTATGATCMYKNPAKLICVP